MTIPSEIPARIARFAPTVRVVHALNAIGFGLLTFTGAAMYGAPGTQWVGRRDLVRNVHVWVGIFLLLPLIVGLASSSGLRDDFRRLSRWSAEDKRWWFKSKRTEVRLGKFNPGQKANASFTLAALLALLGTGAIMKWYSPFGDDWRTGATFVHDWTALALGLVVIGHIYMAIRDRSALDGMIRGTVPSEWAATGRPRWYSEVIQASENDASDLGDSR